MSSAQKTKLKIERLERRRDSLKQRLDGVERWDELRDKAMAEIVKAANKKWPGITDEELIEKVKQELDRRIEPESAVWETISDFGIRLSVDIAVLYVRNRKKALERRIKFLGRRIARQHRRLRNQLGSAGPTSFSDDEEAPAVFASPGAGAGTTLAALARRVERLESLVDALAAEHDAFDDDFELDLDDELEPAEAAS